MTESKDMGSSALQHFFDAGAWRTATWSAPFVVQPVLGILLIVMWLLGKWPFDSHSAYGGERTWMFTSTVITTLVSLGAGVLLLRSPSSRNRGLGLSLASCSVVVLAGGTIFAYLVLR